MFGSSDVWAGGITPEGRVQIWCSAFLHICKTNVLGKAQPENAHLKMHIWQWRKTGHQIVDSYPSRLRIRTTENRTAKFSRPCDFARMAVCASTFIHLTNIDRDRDAH